VRLPPFELHRPATLGAALDLLDRHGERAAPYLGGSDLLPRMRLGLARPHHLVDCKRLPGLAAIGEVDGDLRLGAAATHAALGLDRSASLRACGLAGLARRIGNPRVRNAGTLGGSLCAARSRSDPATLLVALDSVVRLASRDGERELALASFLLGDRRTALGHGELLERVTVPAVGTVVRAGFERVSWWQGPVANVAVVERDDGAVRVAVGAVCPTPVRAVEAERLLTEGGLSALPDACEAAASAVDPVGDELGGRAYKRQLVRVLVDRAIRASLT
jgi:aerobic carbon-monoxide dehydrogenase medium subunit